MALAGVKISGMQSFCKFWWTCIKRAAWPSLKSADDLYGGIGYLALVAVFALLCWLSNIEVTFASPYIQAASLFVLALFFSFIVQLIVAPVWLYNEARARIKRLEIVDPNDLEYLLYGFFFGDTFIYKGEITLCKKFEGKFEIEQLKNHFIDIPVRAPKNSWAQIKIRFSNARQNANSKYSFYYLNEENQPVLVEDIYEDQKIYVDNKSLFRLKFSCDENYIIHDQATIQVTIISWTK